MTLIYLINEILDINKLKRTIAKTHRAFNKQIKKARKENKPREEIQGLISQRFGECQFEEEELKFIRSIRLIRQAEELNVPLPNFSDKKIWTRDNGSIRLTAAGRHHVTKLIRQEKKERRYPFIQIISLLIGLVGALAALMAILSN
ncbi:MAG: hypothetical protein JRF71_14765 [Deltaproteobacteria bacterium]|nr:hypothetical protein [Deltaproteobacteria bacterium]